MSRRLRNGARGFAVSLLLVVGGSAQGNPTKEEAVLEPRPSEFAFRTLERLRSLPSDDPERSTLVGLLEEHLGRVAEEDPRLARLLRVRLEVMEGLATWEAERRLGPLEPWPYTGRANFVAAEVLPPGEPRVRALCAGLRDPATLARCELLLVWNTARNEARALRLTAGALPLQEELHRRYQAPWSAQDLALTLRLLGDERSDLVLAEALDREHDAGRTTAELWSSRGLVALGFGDERTARDYLGRALALGSEGAGLILAKLDLDAGHDEAARRGFRPSILMDPPSAWARRGWGLSLLPKARVVPGRAPALTIPDHE